MAAANKEDSVFKGKVPEQTNYISGDFPETEQDLLNEMTSNDPLVLATMTKKSHAEQLRGSGEGYFPPKQRYVGVDLPFGHLTSFDPQFFIQDLCYVTKTLRIRRSVWRPQKSNSAIQDVYHFINVLVTNPNSAGSGSGNGSFRITMDDVRGLQIALQELTSEIAAYPRPGQPLPPPLV